MIKMIIKLKDILGNDENHDIKLPKKELDTKTKMNIIEIKKKEDSDNRKINENISNKLRDVEIKNRNIEDEYNEKFSKIKQEINVSYEYKEENFLLRNSFISLFNLFYDKLYLERDLNTSPKGINLSPEDYTPKTYETDEIVKYIFLMLKNSTEESTGLLLREIVSYCNMMLRNLQKGEKKIYYEPLSTVRQIESLITAIEVQNEDLKEKIEKNTKINETNEDIINKLQKEINRVDKMLEILHNKMRDYYKKGKKLKGNEEKKEVVPKSDRFEERKALYKQYGDGDISKPEAEDDYNDDGDFM